MVFSYSEEELSIIKSNYGIIPVKEIIKIYKLNRTPSSIRAKANSLGLKSELDHSKETMAKIHSSNSKLLDKDCYTMSEDLAYLIGVLNGDGFLSNYRFGLGTISLKFALHFKKVLQKWSKLDCFMYKEKGEHYSTGFLVRVGVDSKKIKDFLFRYYISKNSNAIQNIKSDLKTQNQIIKFLEGFYDSEGSFDGSRCAYANTNLELINLIKEYLDNYLINSKIYSIDCRVNHINGRSFNSKKLYKLMMNVDGSTYFLGKVNSAYKRKNINLKDKTPEIYLDKIIPKSKNWGIFRTFLSKHHSYKKSSNYVGVTINWLIRKKDNDEVYGVIGLGSSFFAQGIRDKYIGWNRQQKLKNIKKIANNWRFCLRKNVPRNIASKSLSLLLKEGKKEWKIRFGVELCLIESYVTIELNGISYKASSWKEIGITKGLLIKNKKIVGKTTPKRIFVKSLFKNWKYKLTH